MAAVLAVAALGGAAALRCARGPADDLSSATDGPLLHERPAPVPGEVASPGPLPGLDLLRVAVDDEGATAPAAEGRVARLTLDPDLQRTAVALLAAHHLPEAAVVVMDTATAQVLAYASHAETGPARDLCALAQAPAASVFKIVTGAALVAHAGLGPETRQCYSGGEQRLHASDLIDDPQRDRWCVTLSGAMGRSVNAVFAKLAQRHLTPATLDQQARAFGFGEAVPFDAAVEPSKVEIPTDPLGFARTAAGFWNTTLSPVEAAWISATLARGGEALRPSIVREVLSSTKQVLATAPAPSVVRRVTSREAAMAVTTMMEHTVSEGTSYKAFHDPSGTSFLPGVVVAGKTGTLTEPVQPEARLVTWFTGFAPSKPMPGVRQVAVAVLVVNRPTWHVKANVLAREILRAHFAAQKVAGVTRPVLTAVAHKPETRPPRARARH